MNEINSAIKQKKKVYIFIYKRIEWRIIMKKTISMLLAIVMLLGIVMVPGVFTIGALLGGQVGIGTVITTRIR